MKLEEWGCHSVRIIPIGNGQPHRAAIFTKQMNRQEEKMSGSTRETYEAFHLKRVESAKLTRASLKKSTESPCKGHAQTWPWIPTDAPQKWGAVLVDLGEAIQLLHRDDFVGDYAEIEKLVDAIFHHYNL